MNLNKKSFRPTRFFYKTSKDESYSSVLPPLYVASLLKQPLPVRKQFIIYIPMHVIGCCRDQLAMFRSLILLKDHFPFLPDNLSHQTRLSVYRFKMYFSSQCV